jgi:Nucleotidyl transferase AbiEii toxin, Type IV TA system
MTRPSRATASGRVYLDLLARARRESRPSDELLALYVLERFLYRLSVSTHRDHLILKGGMLLSAFGQRRPTRDIDLLAKATSSEPEAVAALVSEIAALETDDGVSYQASQVTTRIIREQDLYAAVRVAVPARIDRARQPLRIDVNVGDPVTHWPPRHRGCQPGRRHRRHRRIPQSELAPHQRGAGDAGPRPAARMAATAHPCRAGRPAAIGLHRGDQAGLGLRRSGDHRFSDIRPLGPPATSVDELGPFGCSSFARMP